MLVSLCLGLLTILNLMSFSNVLVYYKVNMFMAQLHQSTKYQLFAYSPTLVGWGEEWKKSKTCVLS